MDAVLACSYSITAVLCSCDQVKGFVEDLSEIAEEIRGHDTQPMTAHAPQPLPA